MHISSILQNYFLHCKIYILSHPIAPKVRITKILCFRYLFCNFKMTKYVLLHSCRTHHTFKMVLVEACLNPHPHAVSSKLCDVYIWHHNSKGLYMAARTQFKIQVSLNWISLERSFCIICCTHFVSRSWIGFIVLTLWDPISFLDLTFW